MAFSKKVLLTGATGQIGKRLLVDLAKKYQVTAWYRDKKKMEQIKGVDWVEADLDKPLVPKVDVVVHLAGCLGMHNPDCMRVNLEGTKHLLAKLPKDRKVKFIFFSSIEAAAPGSIYGRSKLMAEKEIEKLAQKHKNIDYLIVRVGNVTGLNDKDLGKQFVFWSKNRMVRFLLGRYELSLIDIEEVSKFILAVIGNKVTGRVYLAGKPMSMGDNWVGHILSVPLVYVMKVTGRGGFFMYLTAGGPWRPKRRYES